MVPLKKTRMIQFQTRLGFLIWFCIIILGPRSANAQTNWKTEREKEHGILRLRIKNLNSDYYYFIAQNPQTTELDTLRNQASHLDLGNHELKYGYSLAKQLKAFPSKLYGKTSEPIYDNWEHVSFPVGGLSSAVVFVGDKTSSDTMKLNFVFTPSESLDYVFETEFQAGEFLIKATKLKAYALAENIYGYRFKDTLSVNDVGRFIEIDHLRIRNSLSSNPNLSIVVMDSLKGLKVIRFPDRIRYQNPSLASVFFSEYPVFKKIKYRPAIRQFQAPSFMVSPADVFQQYAYCVEHNYVRPLHLKAHPKTKYHPKRENQSDYNKIKGILRNKKEIQTFGDLEEYLNAILFSKYSSCNQAYYQSTTIHFPFNGDSIVSIEIRTKVFHLPKEDSLVLFEYNKALTKAIEKKENPSQKKLFSWFRKEKKRPTVEVPFMPSPNSFELEMPNYDVEIPRSPDSIIGSPKNIRTLNNGYFSWEAVIPYYDLSSPKMVKQEFYSIVLNPFTMEVFSLDSILGVNYRNIIYEEMEILYKELRAEADDHPFNLSHYIPNNKRQIMWGLENENLLIYYGNEGEFSALKKHPIPIEKFGK